MQNAKRSMAMTTAPQITREQAEHLMRVVDEATKDALARMGLEAFRFDADYSPAEGWMRVKVKIRPATTSRT